MLINSKVRIAPLFLIFVMSRMKYRRNVVLDVLRWISSVISLISNQEMKSTFPLIDTIYCRKLGNQTGRGFTLLGRMNINWSGVLVLSATCSKVSKESYCSTKNTIFAPIEITDLLEGEERALFSTHATRSYGYQLLLDTKKYCYE